MIRSLAVSICPWFAFRCLPLKGRSFPVLLCCRNICWEHFGSGFCSSELSAFSVWFHLPPVERDPCSYAFVEQEEQSWALLVCAEEAFRHVFTQAVRSYGPCWFQCLPEWPESLWNGAGGQGYRAAWSGCRMSVLIFPSLFQLLFFFRVLLSPVCWPQSMVCF